MSSNNTFYCSFVSIHYIICECGDTFPTEEELKVHLETDHSHLNGDTNEYKCATCEKIFASERACIMHQRVHKGIQHRIKKEPKTPEEIQERKRFYNLRKHVCEFCGKLYATNAALRYHQRVHTGERPYQCSMCPKAFTMPLFLQIHIRTHTGERPYQCPRCPKAFSNKAALLRHDRVHTGVKPYPCPKCGKTFTQSNSMKLHVNTVHLKMPAPYKSKARKMKEAARKMQLADAAALNNTAPIKTEMEVYEDGTIYTEEANPDEIYEEVQVGQMGELGATQTYSGAYYEQVKQEGEEVLLYDEAGGEIFYEEVYEIAEPL